MARSRILEAMGLGLAGALLTGAVFLCIESYRAFHFDCDDLTPLECELQRSAALVMGRWQALSGLALALGAIGLLLLVRARVRSAPDA